MTTLERLLDVEQLEVDLFRGASPATLLQHIFGGQVAGQRQLREIEIVRDPGRRRIERGRAPKRLAGALPIASQQPRPAKVVEDFGPLRRQLGGLAVGAVGLRPILRVIGQHALGVPCAPGRVGPGRGARGERNRIAVLAATDRLQRGLFEQQRVVGQRDQQRGQQLRLRLALERLPDSAGALTSLAFELGLVMHLAIGAFAGMAPGDVVNRYVDLSNTGGIRETQDMIDFCAANGVRPELQKIPMTGIDEAWSVGGQIEGWVCADDDAPELSWE